MNCDPFGWCHHCDEPVADYHDFALHASNGHAVTNARCPGSCQFVGAR